MAKKTDEQEYRTKTDRVNSSRAGRRRKKRLREALVVCSILVFVFVIALLCISIFLKVSTIVVETEGGRYSAEEIAAASEIKVGESLMRINKNTASGRISKNLPYIGTAEISITLPDTVTIHVEYAEPKMCVDMAGGLALLDIHGKVLQTGVGMPEKTVAEITGAPVVSAVPGQSVEFEQEDLFTYVTGLAEACEDAGVTCVTKIDFSNLLDVTLEVDSSIEVRLGPISKSMGKLRFGKEVIERTKAKPKLAGTKYVIDLTGDDSAYVRTQDKIDGVKQPEVVTDAEGNPVAPPDAQNAEEEDAGENENGEDYDAEDAYDDDEAEDDEEPAQEQEDGGDQEAYQGAVG